MVHVIDPQQRIPRRPGWALRWRPRRPPLLLWGSVSITIGELDAYVLPGG